MVRIEAGRFGTVGVVVVGLLLLLPVVASPETPAFAGAILDLAAEAPWYELPLYVGAGLFLFSSLVTGASVATRASRDSRRPLVVAGVNLRAFGNGLAFAGVSGGLLSFIVLATAVGEGDPLLILAYAAVVGPFFLLGCYRLYGSVARPPKEVHARAREASFETGRVGAVVRRVISGWIGTLVLFGLAAFFWPFVAPGITTLVPLPRIVSLALWVAPFLVAWLAFAYHVFTTEPQDGGAAGSTATFFDRSEWF